MHEFESCLIRPMQRQDLERVLDWRNHPDIRRVMLTQHEITLPEHRVWFERSSADPAKRLLIVEEHGVPLGYVHFIGVATGAAADWGFYAAPDADKGSGRKLGRAALHFAFQGLGLHKVCGQALSFNHASVRFHRSLGFQQEGVLREQHLLGNAYHDLICFGLLRHEWNPAKSTRPECPP